MELHSIKLLRALVEISGMFLFAQGALYLLVGVSRDQNIVYQLLAIATRPVIYATRSITPKVISGKRIPLVGFF